MENKNMLSESKFYMGYSRWDDLNQRYETWEESVARVMNMHREKYKDIMSDVLETAMQYAQQAYSDKLVLGAQRALQFGGEQIFKHESRMYNCSVSYIDRPAFFNECMYLMLSGVGVGFSVGKKYINQLPTIARRSQKKAKIFQVPDSIEGWADAFGVLLSSYFTEGATHPEYRGCQVHFDFTKIRPSGAKISGGFKAPGPDGLRKSLIKCEDLLENLLTEKPVTKINSITAYDFVMHMSDAVLSGGVRRSATICIFDKDDNDMLTAKTGDWFVNNPQRGRSNNSALIIRDDITREEWANIMKSVKDFGEPGFIFSDSDEFLFNPCVSGDTLLNVKEHDVISDGVKIAEGVEYKMPMSMYVDNFVDGENNPLVLSYNKETNESEYCVVTAAAMTRKDADVILIELDDGKVIKCTPDHKIYTKNRGWVEANELSDVDELVTIV
jgi:ribonucleoside-triphosphate reductase (thioredoxin)